MTTVKPIDIKVNELADYDLDDDFVEEAVLKACNRVYFGNHQDADYEVYRVYGETFVNICVKLPDFHPQTEEDRINDHVEAGHITAREGEAMKRRLQRDNGPWEPESDFYHTKGA